MGRTGRTLANALIEFGIGYDAVERDEKRLLEAIADGYAVAFGDSSNPRMWEPSALHGRRVIVLTAPSFEVSRELAPAAGKLFPDLKAVAVVRDEAEAAQFRSIGVLPVVNRSAPPGLDLAVLVLTGLGIEAERIGRWMREEQERALSESQVLAA